MNITLLKASDLIVRIVKAHNDSGLSPSQLALLAYLYKSPRLCSSTELAIGCGLNRRQVETYLSGSCIDTLIKKGYISVIEQKSGVRHYYNITPAGRSVIESEALLIRDYLKELV